MQCRRDHWIVRDSLGKAHLMATIYDDPDLPLGGEPPEPIPSEPVEAPIPPPDSGLPNVWPPRVEEPVESPAPATPAIEPEQDSNTPPLDAIGDIPPPPIPPPPPAPVTPRVPDDGGIAGAPGAPTFALPGTIAARPFRTPAFSSTKRGTRFGPGVPVTGGAPMLSGGGGDESLGIGPDEAAELLRRLAGGM